MKNKETKKKKSKNDLFIALGILIFIIFFKLALVYQNSQDDNFNSGNYTEPKDIEESEVAEGSEGLLDTINELLSRSSFWNLIIIFTVIYFFFGIIYRVFRAGDLI